MEFLEQDELNDIVGKNIKYFRKFYNLKFGKMTQEQLAELVDVSTALIGNLESEKVSQGLSIYTLYKISIVLRVPMEKFFEKSQNFDEKVS